MYDYCFVIAKAKVFKLLFQTISWTENAAANNLFFEEVKKLLHLPWVLKYTFLKCLETWR